MIWVLLGALYLTNSARVHLATFNDTLSLGDALVASGTLALAAVTLWLAWQTRREVSLSTKSIDLAREGIEAQDMPFVIAVTNPDQGKYFDASFNRQLMWWGWEPADGVYWLQARLWNIGKGPAIAGDIRLVLDGEDLLAPRSAEIGEIVVAPGQVHDINVFTSSEPLDRDGWGTLRVYFAHSSGSEYMTISQARISERGVRCADFRHRRSDAEGRPFSA